VKVLDFYAKTAKKSRYQKLVHLNLPQIMFKKSRSERNGKDDLTIYKILNPYFNFFVINIQEVFKDYKVNNYST